MTPPDFRNENFAALNERIDGVRLAVWSVWMDRTLRDGATGATTREAAAGSGIDLLTFRPRTTELYQIGALRLADVQPDKKEARYVVRSAAEMLAWFAAQRAQAESAQIQMPLGA